MTTYDLNENMRKRAPTPAADTQAPNSAPSLDALYRKHAKEISVFIARTFGAGPPDPEDAAQAAFAQFAALSEPEAIGNPRAFLFRSARNFVLDYRRRQSTQRRYADELGENLADPPAQQDQQRVLEGKERWAAVMTAVHTLEPRRRKVLIWHALHELTFAEIAHRLGVSKVRVRQLFAEAIATCEAATRDLDMNEGAQ
jgi:RNA polymerase sigma-70 factor (ECF subfamily)